MSAVVELTIGGLRSLGEHYGSYGSALADACAREPPPFGEAWYGETYRKLACDPEWLARSLIANAQKEADGARKLAEIAAKAPDGRRRRLVWRHAADESRHARLYISVLGLLFFEDRDTGLKDSLEQISPGFRFHAPPQAGEPVFDEEFLDEIVQMNLGEIRTRIHQLLLLPVASILAGERRPAVEKVLTALLRDELRHIKYTSMLLEEELAGPRSELARRLLRARLAEFNEITLAEVGDRVFEGS